MSEASSAEIAPNPPKAKPGPKPKAAPEADSETFGSIGSKAGILYLRELVRLTVMNADVITVAGTSIHKFGGATVMLATSITQTDSGFVVDMAKQVNGLKQLFIPASSVSFACPLPEQGE